MRQYSLFLIIIIGRLIMLNKGVDCLQYVFYSLFEYDEIDCIITFLSKKSPSTETFTESMIISSPKFFSENFPRFHFFNYSFFGAFFWFGIQFVSVYIVEKEQQPTNIMMNQRIKKMLFFSCNQINK